jgi:hypothetical protein
MLGDHQQPTIELAGDDGVHGVAGGRLCRSVRLGSVVRERVRLRHEQGGCDPGPLHEVRLVHPPPAPPTAPGGSICCMHAGVAVMQNQVGLDGQGNVAGDPTLLAGTILETVAGITGN